MLLGVVFCLAGTTHIRADYIREAATSAKIYSANLNQYKFLQNVKHLRNFDWSRICCPPFVCAFFDMVRFIVRAKQANSCIAALRIRPTTVKSQ